MQEVILLISENCPYCPKAKEIWENLNKKYNFRLKIINVLSEEGRRIIKKYNIMAVPTTLIDEKIVFIGIPDVNKAVEFISK